MKKNDTSVKIGVVVDKSKATKYYSEDQKVLHDINESTKTAQEFNDSHDRRRKSFQRALNGLNFLSGFAVGIGVASIIFLIVYLLKTG